MVTEQPGTDQRSARRRTPKPAKAKRDDTATAERRDHAPMVRWATVPVPVPVAVRLPAGRPSMPHLSMPGLGLPSAAVRAARSAADTVAAAAARLPAPRRLVYYGALGAMAVVGALEWPVAAAIGAGVWVAGRTGRDADRPGRAGAAQPDTAEVAASKRAS